MNYKICLFFIILCNFIEAQNTYSDIVKPKLSFTFNKSEATNPFQYVVLKTDTLYVKYNTYNDLSHLSDTLTANKKFLNKYLYTIFRLTDEYSEKPLIIKQWNCPIIVYIDKNLPRNVRKGFQNFYSQLNGIENLEIVFTNKLENANYYIKVVDQEANGYSSNFEFKSEEEKNDFMFTGATYILKKDANSKLYSCILKINIEGKNEIQLLKQLKQVFYFTLGQFSYTYRENPDSLLGNSYIDSERMGDFDLYLLKTHYKIIYDEKINGTKFKKLIKLANNRGK